MLHSAVENLLHMAVAEGVEDSLAVSPRSDETRLFQHTELMRDSGLRHTEELCDITDAHLALTEDVYHAYPCWVAEDFQKLRRLVKHSLVGHHL